MTYLISSREGRLCLDGKRLPQRITRSTFPFDSFVSGDFSIEASMENIQIISQCFLDLYVVPMGGQQLPRGWGYTSQDVEIKYKTIPDEIEGDAYLFNPVRRLFRSSRNLTRGWCLLSCATLHRFFWKEFDLYRSPCPYDVENDYHWWLQNQDGDVIDLTEEQYRISRIYEPRSDGKKMTSLPAASYAVRGRNLSLKLAEYVSASTISKYAPPKYMGGAKGYKTLKT